MSETEMITAIMAMTCGVAFSTFFFSQVFKLIRLSIEKRHGPQEARDMQLREEFVKFRRQLEQRMGTMEAQLGADAGSKQLTSEEKPRLALPDAEPEADDRLPNMLRQQA